MLSRLDLLKLKIEELERNTVMMRELAAFIAYKVGGFVVNEAEIKDFMENGPDSELVEISEGNAKFVFTERGVDHVARN